VDDDQMHDAGVRLRLATAAACGILFTLAGACAPLRVELPAGTPARCLGPAASHVAWDRPAETGALDAWCAAVGPAVVVAGAAPAERPIRRLVVVSWNVHVGGGRVAELISLTRLRSGQLGAGTGLVLLLQETFREGTAVGTAPRGAPVPDPIRPARRSGDVVRLAHQLGMSAFYVPSMRNGGSKSPDDWEDRGSAILSTEPLDGFTAIELPIARQRRVAVMATVRPRRAAAAPLRVVAAHFDVVLFGSRAVRQAEHLASRLQALNRADVPTIIGADVNATTGFRHGAVRALAGVVPLLRACGTGPTSSWLARSDFLFATADPAMTRCETLEDRHGSDHRPIVLTIDYPPR
jgi:endonuclease/exonuclease/phosphatase family metal-dependent hydrolase